MPNYIDGKKTKKNPEGRYSGVDWDAVVGPMLQNPLMDARPRLISPDMVGGGQAHLGRFEQAPIPQAMPQGIPASGDVPYEVPNIMVQYPAPPPMYDVAARQMGDFVQQIPAPVYGMPMPSRAVQYPAAIEDLSQYGDPLRKQMEDYMRQVIPVVRRR